MKNGLIFVGMGFQLLGLVVGALYVGQLIDNKFGLGGLGIAGMVISVLIGWFVHLLYLLKKHMEAEERESKDINNPPR